MSAHRTLSASAELNVLTLSRACEQESHTLGKHCLNNLRVNVVQYLQRVVLCAVLAGLASFRRLDDELGEFVVHPLVPVLCVSEIAGCTVPGRRTAGSATALVGIAAQRDQRGS